MNTDTIENRERRIRELKILNLIDRFFWYYNGFTFDTQTFEKGKDKLMDDIIQVYLDDKKVMNIKKKIQREDERTFKNGKSDICYSTSLFNINK